MSKKIYELNNEEFEQAKENPVFLGVVGLFTILSNSVNDIETYEEYYEIICQMKKALETEIEIK